MTPEQKQLEQIRERQIVRRQSVTQTFPVYDEMSGDIDFLLSLVKEQEAASNGVSNHVFTCSACGRQWTVDSQDTLECFFVGLCYWCIRQSQLSKEQIDQCLRSLALTTTSADRQAKATEIVEEYKQRVMQLPSGDAVPCSTWLGMRLRIALDLASAVPVDAATAMRSACVEKLRERASRYKALADASLPNDQTAARTAAAAAALNSAADELESLSIEKQEG